MSGIATTVADWFMQAPLQNFLLLFGGSGLVAAVFKWGGLWSDRRRLSVKVLSETYEIGAAPNLVVTLRFDVTNVGDKVASLERSVTMLALAPRSVPSRFQLEVIESDRQLQPHSQKEFTATASVGASYAFGWFKRYHFHPARGARAIVRFRNAENKEIGFIAYWWGYFRFRYLQRVPDAA